MSPPKRRASGWVSAASPTQEFVLLDSPDLLGKTWSVLVLALCSSDYFCFSQGPARKRKARPVIVIEKTAVKRVNINWWTKQAKRKHEVTEARSLVILNILKLYIWKFYIWVSN